MAPILSGDLTHPLADLDLATVEATLVIDELPRRSWLALWRALPVGPPGEARPERPIPNLHPIDGADREVELVLPAKNGVRRRPVAVRALAMSEILDTLVGLPAETDVRPSVRAWSAGARLAVEMAARGRLLPARTPSGLDTWRLGPLDPDDLVRRQALVDALPAAAHAVLVPGSSPLAITSPEVAVDAFFDAVADVLPRTAAASVAAGHVAYASPQPTDVEVAAPWLDDAAIGERAKASVSLRLLPPAEPDGRAGSDDRDEDDRFRAVVQLQSRADPSLVIDAAALWSSPEVVAARFGDDADLDLLLTLRRAARVFPPLVRLLDQPRPDELLLHDDEAAELLGPVVDDLAGAGVTVLWPTELIQLVDLHPTITPTPTAVTAAGLTLESLLEVRWRATVDGEQLTDDELTALAEAKRGVVRLRGRWVRADPERLARVSQRRQLSAGEGLAAALDGHLVLDGETVDVQVDGPLMTIADRLRDLTPDREADEPDGFDAVLRPYQRRGLAWLSEMADIGLGGILADDMGLGKTIQLLALLVARRNQGDDRPTLIVCPVSLLANWQREAARFATGLTVRRHHGSTRTLDHLVAGEVVLATYGVARRDADALGAVEWGLVVTDEAQAIKNPYSRTARALRTLPAGARFALTGTPVENRLSELWAILDWTTPGLLGPLDRFRHEIAVPVERDRDPDATATFARLVRPFVLRRRKSDPTIAPDLPPKTETDQPVPLTDEQTTLYRAVVSQTLDEIAAAEGIARRGLVLRLLTALKQICNHPAHYLDQQEPLTGRSGKLDAAAELVEVVRSEGDAVLIFTQYVAMGRLLERHLSEHGARTAFLHGRVPAARRQTMVDGFQAGDTDTFIISLKAGGTGLNLTAATHVVHYDRWWNPAVEDQASDRAWRIGQDRPVQVHRLICEGTLEDRIADLLRTKRDLADAVVGGGEGWITELDDDELAELVALSSGSTS